MKGLKSERHGIRDFKIWELGRYCFGKHNFGHEIGDSALVTYQQWVT